MRAVRERPRVFVAVGWAALGLVLVGALLGATASTRAGRDEREALIEAPRAAGQAGARADAAEGEVGELAESLRAERRRAGRLERKLRSARRKAARRKERRR